MGEKAPGGVRAAIPSFARTLNLKVKTVVARLQGRHVPRPKPASDFPAAWAVHRGQPFSDWNGLRFELVRDMAGLLKLADGWRELTRGLNPARHFHHVEWFLAVTRTLDEFGDGSYFYVAIYDAQRLVGVVPLRVTTAWVYGVEKAVPVKALRLLSNVRETPSTRDVIFRDSLLNADIFTGLMRYLDKMNPWWDVIALTDVIEGAHAQTAFLKNTTLPGLTTFGRACGGQIESISCGPDDAALQRLSTGFRKDLRNAHNRVARQQPQFVHAATSAELRETYPKLVAVEARGWKRDSESSIANHPRFHAFLQHLITYFEQVGGVEIHLLQLGEQTAAGALCVRSGRINFLHVIGYDNAYSKMSPGHLLLEELVTTEGRMGRVDLITAGHASSWFSAAWKPDHIQTVSDHYLFRPTRRGEKMRERFGQNGSGEIDRPN